MLKQDLIPTRGGGILSDKLNRATIDKEAQEEAAQDYLRLQAAVEEETTLTGKRLREKTKKA